jgi:hypothetical protein
MMGKQCQAVLARRHVGVMCLLLHGSDTSAVRNAFVFRGDQVADLLC